MLGAASAAVLAALAVAAGAADTGGAPEVSVQTRNIPGSDVKELTAHGVIQAPPHAVRAAIADLERYPAFMPYVKESRVLGRAANGEALNYQRLSFGVPFLKDRHYVIRIAERRYRDGDRVAYRFAWRLEDGLPADAAADAVRVSVNNGYWDVRPGTDANSTDVRYCVFTDPAGALPKWLVGVANADAVPKLFAAVADAARTSAYATAVEPVEGISAGEAGPPAGCAEPAGVR